MAYIISIEHLPLTSTVAGGLTGDSGGHGGGGGGGGTTITTDSGSGLPPKGINLDNAAYPPSAGWIPVKAAGQPALEMYSSDPAKDALAQAWRTVRHSTNAQNSYQPPVAYQSVVNMEATNKPISGGGAKDIGFRKIAVSRVKVEEDRT